MWTVTATFECEDQQAAIDLQHALVVLAPESLASSVVKEDQPAPTD